MEDLLMFKPNEETQKWFDVLKTGHYLAGLMNACWRQGRLEGQERVLKELGDVDFEASS